MQQVFVISLGCDKNRVDTENMLHALCKNGFGLTDDPSAAHIILINTCAFLNSARAEAIDTILEYSRFKAEGICRKLIVTGCLPKLFLNELKDGLPEVDEFIGLEGYRSIVQAVDGEASEAVETAETEIGKAVEADDTKKTDKPGRILTTAPHYAYLKIADGCNNRCSYCLIPSIRGAYRSRPIPELTAEAAGLSASGVRELILVAQDTTRYGVDLYGKPNITELLRELLRTDIELIRILYCYPEAVTDELLAMIAAEPRIAKYIDVPMQHVSTSILKAMNRRNDYQSTLKLIDRIRAADPKIAIRSTFITGFPGETAEDFALLCDFLREARLDSIGFFAYSPEDGTPAYSLPNQIDEGEKQERVRRLYEIQRDVSRANNMRFVGQTLRVRYEDIDFDRQMFKGRGEMHAPDIDGSIFFTAKNVEVGEIYDIIITDADDYDLFGKISASPRRKIK